MEGNISGNCNCSGKKWNNSKIIVTKISVKETLG